VAGAPATNARFMRSMCCSQPLLFLVSFGSKTLPALLFEGEDLKRTETRPLRSIPSVFYSMVGNDGDDHKAHDGGVAHFCPKCVSLNETADGHNHTLNNNSGSPKPPLGLDNEVAENSDAGQGGENHYLLSGQPRIPSIPTKRI